MPRICFEVGAMSIMFRAASSTCCALSTFKTGLRCEMAVKGYCVCCVGMQHVDMLSRNISGLLDGSWSPDPSQHGLTSEEERTYSSAPNVSTDCLEQVSGLPRG